MFKISSPPKITDYHQLRSYARGTKPNSVYAWLGMLSLSCLAVSNVPGCVQGEFNTTLHQISKAIDQKDSPLPILIGMLLGMSPMPIYEIIKYKKANTEKFAASLKKVFDILASLDQARLQQMNRPTCLILVCRDSSSNKVDYKLSVLDQASAVAHIEECKKEFTIDKAIIMEPQELYSMLLKSAQIVSKRLNSDNRERAKLIDAITNFYNSGIPDLLGIERSTLIL